MGGNLSMCGATGEARVKKQEGEVSFLFCLRGSL